MKKYGKKYVEASKNVDKNKAYACLCLIGKHPYKKHVTCCVPNSVEGGMVIGINGDIKQSCAMQNAYEMGKSLK